VIDMFRPVAAAVAVTLGLCLLGSGSAVAAEGITVGISDVESSSTTVTGVLTFRSADVIEVESGSLTAAIDEKPFPATVAASTHLQRTAMLVIDTSGSMGSSGMATVRAATRTYLKEAPEDVRIGVVTFADTAGVDLKPTHDRAEAQRVVDGLASRGDTSLYAAVAAGIKAVGRDGDRSMVLLSDGADTISQDRKGDLEKATADLRKLGIRVDVVRFKTNDPDATSALKGFADASGGSVIAADNADAVGTAFQTAARALKSQAQFEVTTGAPISGTHTLRITGIAGGEPFTVLQTVDLGPGGATAPKGASPPTVDNAGVILPDLVLKVPAERSPLPFVAAGTVGLALFLLAFGALTPTFETRRERRLAAIDNYVQPVRRLSRSEGKAHSTPIAEQLVGLGERAMKGRKSTARTMELINRADLPLRPGEWWVLSVVAVIVGVAIGLLMLPQAHIVGAVIGAVPGLILPQMVLRFLAARRAKAFERILPDALTLVSTSLKSGFGLPQALDAVARDAAEPVAKEFSRALAETRIGTDIADALERVAERMGSEAMGMAVMAIRIQREVGGNLAETLGTTATTLREREALFRQVRALSAEGRLSAYILIALPIGLFLYMLKVNYDYVSLLWTTMPGIFMSIGAAVMLMLGIVWMRNVVKIEV
jgi:tight adherence protein B